MRIIELINQSISIYGDILVGNTQLEDSLRKGDLTAIEGLREEIDAAYMNLAPIDSEINDHFSRRNPSTDELQLLAERLEAVRKVQEKTDAIKTGIGEQLAHITRELKSNQQAATAMNGYATNPKKQGKIVNKKY